MKPAALIEKLQNSWIPTVYLDKVRSQRTRSYVMDIPERENKPEILFTLLGIELKVGKKRFSCPDLATARYLLVFARLGCRDVAIPYDITKISVIADELEVAWQKLLLFHDDQLAGSSPQGYGRSRAALVRKVRQEITETGAGSQMPEFKNSTRQRKS